MNDSFESQNMEDYMLDPTTCLSDYDIHETYYDNKDIIMFGAIKDSE